MRLDDISQVMEIERESFPTMWPLTAFKRELEHNLRLRQSPENQAQSNVTLPLFGGRSQGGKVRRFAPTSRLLGFPLRCPDPFI